MLTDELSANLQPSPSTSAQAAGKPLGAVPDVSNCDDEICHGRSSRWYALFSAFGSSGPEIRERSIAMSAASGSWRAQHNEIRRIERKRGWIWDRLRITHRAAGQIVEVRGLRKADADVILDLLEFRKPI